MSDLTDLRDRLREFAHEREWEQFHTPRNLVLALTGEVGELAALLQWVPDAAVEEEFADDSFRKAFADELADCLAYLIQIADRVGIDLRAAAEAKINENAEKYPPHLARGRATKYTQLQKELLE